MIYIDGEDTYRLTPETFKIREGVHTIKLTKKDYADYETSVTVYSDRTVKYTLTKLTPTPVPPIEIEVRKGELKGYVDIGASRIPRSITVGSKYTYRIRVENPSDGVTAVYWVTLDFIGTGDVAGKKFSFTSEESKPVDPGDGISLYVDVLLPFTALADTRATYELWVTLNGREATVAAGV
ncbi:MAG: PEGA domain-containing protein [Deltaproteobacteria bacterium]|nr:PEGA domain-containing protein [Deltaproteobacteria bacterium]